MLEKGIFLAVVLALVVSLFACSPDPQEATQSPIPAPKPSPAPTPTLKPSPEVAPITINDEDIEWLATVIASEAGSIYDKGSWIRCTDEERAAVGWTVLNRLKAGTYGDKIKDIVIDTYLINLQ